jgi:hypothetical protein
MFASHRCCYPGLQDNVVVEVRDDDGISDVVGDAGSGSSSDSSRSVGSVMIVGLELARRQFPEPVVS